jgi:hypothetical protein
VTSVLERPGAPTAPAEPLVERWWAPLALFAVLAALVWTAAYVGAEHLPRRPEFPRPEVFASPRLVEPWVRWDGLWYRAIAEDGYVYYPGVQSSVAFFPSYPLLLRAVRAVVGDTFVGGPLVTLACGAAAVALFRRWCADRLPAATAFWACALLVTYPYAVYLYGPMYADALLLAATLGAFVALERERLWLAVACGIVATGARPSGLVVGVAVVARLWELRSAARHALLPVPPPIGLAAKVRATVLAHADPRALRPGDARILAVFAGFGGYVGYLWSRFDDPLLFSAIQSAPGWDQGGGPRVWLKVVFVERVAADWTDPAALGLLLQVTFLVLALVLVPAVARRFGWAYALLVVGVLALPLVGSKDFQGTGRYLLPCAPVLAVAAQGLDRRPRLRAVMLGASVVGLLAFAQWYGRGNYLA